MSTVGIVGLGLIGGSMAKAYAQAGWTVLGDDRDRVMLDFARMSGAVHGLLDAETVKTCDLLLLAIPPQAAVEDLRKRAPDLAPSTLVIDLCGTKRVVCEALFPLAARYGFTYVGGHPMAGTHNAGFKYARANLFKGAPMVLVPPEGHDMTLLQRVKEALEPAGFGKLSVTTAEAHDRMIAFTSQMCHVVSNAYMKSPTARQHKGFSAGSYKDLTRVAWLNPQMWAELFLENKDNVLFELDQYLHSLQAYRDALAQEDMETLVQLLDEGKRRKEEVDG